jgi:sulfoxide reductase heme-binding subunit YedZ
VTAGGTRDSDSPNGRDKLSYWERRLARHAVLGLVSLCVGAIVWTWSPHRSRVEGVSFATAYAGVAMLAVALVLGPLNLLRRRPNPVSTDLRRDVGLWAGLWGVAHTIAGLQVHMGGDLRRYFLPAASGSPVSRSTLAFVTANYLGFIGALLLIVLMLLSNDIALKTLGVGRWKWLQRSSYLVLGFVVLHGALYQLLEKRSVGLVVVLTVVTTFAIVLQVAGVRAQRRRRSIGARET